MYSLGSKKRGIFIKTSTPAPIFWTSVRQRHYYQLKSGKLESAIDELGFFYKSLKEKNKKKNRLDT